MGGSSQPVALSSLLINTHLEHIVIDHEKLPGCHERIHLLLQGLRCMYIGIRTCRFKESTRHILLHGKHGNGALSHNEYTT